MTVADASHPSAGASSSHASDSSSGERHTPWSRIIVRGTIYPPKLGDVGAWFGCDGDEFGCEYVGKYAAIREHMRGCDRSPSGQLYRILGGIPLEARSA